MRNAGAFCQLGLGEPCLHSSLRQPRVIIRTEIQATARQQARDNWHRRGLHGSAVARYCSRCQPDHQATSYSIGKHFETFIEGLIESGRYSTASEIMRDGLRMVEEREQRRNAKLEALRAEIQKGFDSGPAEETDIADMIKSVKARGRQRLAAEKHAK